MVVNKEQVARLLESLADFYTVPRAGLDLAGTLAANAQRAQLEAKRRFGASLSSDSAGVKALSELLTRMHHAVKPGKVARLFGSTISFHSAVLIANTFGAFLGETMRQMLGGEWRFVESQGQRLVSLYFDEKNWSLPTYKAGKHFMKGEEDDVMFFYEVFAQRRSTGGLTDALVITSADIEKGQEHLLDLLARHEASKKNKPED